MPTSSELLLSLANPRHCIHCGKSDADVKFRSPRALKCVECDRVAAKARKKYHADYHAARGRAMRILIERHPEEWDRVLSEEHEKVKNERGH